MKLFRRIGSLVALAAWTIALLGCGPQRKSVHGRVTLDGQPLDEAAILFVPLEVSRKKAGASIAQGAYQLAVEDGLLPGKYRVEIADNPPLSSASHAVPGGQPQPIAPRRAIPAGYARDSPLRLEIAEREPHERVEFNCDLVTRP